MKESEKKTTEKVIAAIAVVQAAGLIFCMAFPSGWHIKTTHVWTFYVGLFNVHIKMDTLGGSLVKGAVMKMVGRSQMEKMLEVLEPSEHSIQFYRDQFCNIELLSGGILNNCQIWNSLYIGSLIAALGLFIAVVALLAGVVLLFLAPSRCIRRSCLICFFIASFSSIGGLAGYCGLSYQFSNWLVNVFLSSKALTLSTTAIVCGLVSCSTLLTPALLLMCGRMQSDEEWEGEGFYGEGQYYDPSMGQPPAGCDPNMGAPPSSFGPPAHPIHGTPQPASA